MSALGRSPGEGHGSTPVFFPGEFHGPRSLAHYCLWGLKESHITELLTLICTIVPVSGVQRNGWIFIYIVK